MARKLTKYYSFIAFERGGIHSLRVSFSANSVSEANMKALDRYPPSCTWGYMPLTAEEITESEHNSIQEFLNSEDGSFRPVKTF